MNEKKLNILLVDDEQKFLDTISERVEMKGFNPLTATSGEEAIEIAKKETISAAVVDLKMPGIDGLATISKLQEIHPDIKTILLTGFGDEKVKEATEKLDSEYFEKEDMGGFWNFLKKLRSTLEKDMAAAGMSDGGDIDDPTYFSKKGKEKKE